MPTSTAGVERSTLHRQPTSQRVVELLLPVCLAASPYAQVMRDYFPEFVFDVVTVVLLLFAVLLTTTFARLPAILVLLALFGATVATITQRPNLMAITLIPLIVFALQHVDVRKVLKTFLIVSVGLFVLIVGAYYLFGFNSAYDVHMWRAYKGSFEDRNSLGFTHPNRAMPAWAVVAITMLAFTSPRRRWVWIAVVSTVTFFLYALTDSRTSTLLIAAVVIFALLLNRKLDDPAPPVVRAAAIVAPLALTIFSFASSAFSGVKAIDTVLSGRPSIYAGLLDRYSIFAPFGTAGVESEIVDSGYIQLVLAKGLILAVVYLVTITVVVARSVPSWRSIMILGAFLSLSLAETALMNMPFLLILLGSLEIDRRLAPPRRLVVGTPAHGVQPLPSGFFSRRSL